MESITIFILFQNTNVREYFYKKSKTCKSVHMYKKKFLIKKVIICEKFNCIF